MMIHRVPPPTTSLLQVGLPMASPGVVPGLDTLGEVVGLFAHPLWDPGVSLAFPLLLRWGLGSPLRCGLGACACMTGSGPFIPLESWPHS